MLQRRVGKRPKEDPNHARAAARDAAGALCRVDRPSSGPGQIAFIVGHFSDCPLRGDLWGRHLGGNGSLRESEGRVAQGVFALTERDSLARHLCAGAGAVEARRVAALFSELDPGSQ